MKIAHFLPIATLLLILISCKGNSNTGKVDSTMQVEPSKDSSDVEPSENSLVENKKNEGIDFYAIGQEPGWSLSMDEGNVYIFKSYDGVEMSTPPAPGITEGNTTTYSIQTDSGDMVITIKAGDCFDVMSGRKYPFQVNVGIKKVTDTAAKQYQGCGFNVVPQ